MDSGQVRISDEDVRWPGEDIGITDVDVRWAGEDII